MTARKSDVRRTVLDVVFILVGAIIYSVGLNMLIVPNRLTSGGLTGLATQLNFLFDIPIGIMVLLMNIPLLFWGWRVLGGRFVVLTVFATVISSVMIDVLKLWVPDYHGDQLLVALFGGALTGLGVSFFYLRGTSMGGSDIVCTIINKRFSHIPIGKISLALNSVVIFSAMFVYGNVESALCSAVGAFVSSKVIDAVLIGAESGNVFYVITNNPDMLAKEIHRLVGRGATVLPARGTYAGEDKYMLLCVARRNEYYKIKRIVKSLDDKAFMIVSDTREVLGNGFKSI